MKIKLRLLLVVGFGVAVFITATYASMALLKPKPSVWYLVNDTPEFTNVAKNFLCTEEIIKQPSCLKKIKITKKELIDSATMQTFNLRYTAYRFKSKKTCGRRGCLHVVIDNHMQRQKAFVLAIPKLLEPEESYLLVENNCVTAVQTNLSKLTEKYPLCLKLN